MNNTENIKDMTVEEIEAKIDRLESAIFYEEMKDYNWNYNFISDCKKKIADLEEELAKRKGE